VPVSTVPVLGLPGGMGGKLPQPSRSTRRSPRSACRSKPRRQTRTGAIRRLRARYLGRRPSLGVTPPTAPSPDGLGPNADRTGLPDAQVAGQGKHPRRHGSVMPVPRQVRPLCPTTWPEAGTARLAPTTHRTRRARSSRRRPPALLGRTPRRFTEAPPQGVSRARPGTRAGRGLPADRGTRLMHEIIPYYAQRPAGIP
jgi:hypothetical protein